MKLHFRDRASIAYLCLAYRDSYVGVPYSSRRRQDLFHWHWLVGCLLLTHLAAGLSMWSLSELDNVCQLEEWIFWNGVLE
jgi:hypothetical protein